MKYYTYNESKEYLKTFNIKSSYVFYTMVKEGSFNEFLNKRPYEYFNTQKRKDWISWSDFLSISGEEKYLTFEEAKSYVNKLGLKSQKEWVNWSKNRNDYEIKIPSNPDKIYKENGWISMSDWLGMTTYKNKKNIEYISYIECKEYIKQKLPEIKNKKYWTNLDKSKLPIFIPKRPDYIYKKTNEWISWESFLNSDLSPRSKSKLFLKFEDAKSYIQKLKFKDQYEFSKFIEDNDIDFIPKRPDSAYKKDWLGYIDFLGCENNRESIGERLVKKYLDENNIKYIREKKFEDCKNINHLPFDFYLTDYNICIEYDGELHYRSSDIFGGNDTLNRVKKNDKIKDNWCLSNNIKLIRISYLNKNKIHKILKKELI